MKPLCNGQSISARPVCAVQPNESKLCLSSKKNQFAQHLPVRPRTTFCRPRQSTSGTDQAAAFRRRGVVIGAAVVATLAIIYIATIFFHNLTHESTDDAFIDAHIVSVAPKIAGNRGREVSDNQLVKKGQILLEIDPRDMDAEVARKQAALEVAKARLENAQMSAEQAEAHVKTLQAAYAAAQASTQAAAAETAKQRGDLARNSGLIASGAISKQDFQHSQSDTTSSEATSESKKKQLQAAAAYAEEGKKQAGSARAQASAARAEVTAAEAELHQAELQKSILRFPRLKRAE